MSAQGTYTLLPQDDWSDDDWDSITLPKSPMGVDPIQDSPGADKNKDSSELPKSIKLPASSTAAKTEESQLPASSGTIMTDPFPPASEPLFPIIRPDLKNLPMITSTPDRMVYYSQYKRRIQSPCFNEFFFSKECMADYWYHSNGMLATTRGQGDKAATVVPLHILRHILKIPKRFNFQYFFVLRGNTANSYVQCRQNFSNPSAVLDAVHPNAVDRGLSVVLVGLEISLKVDSTEKSEDPFLELKTLNVPGISTHICDGSFNIFSS